jgi:hypothetical protein
VTRRFGIGQFNSTPVFTLGRSDGR